MRVRRLGRLFGSEMGPAWMVSHAAYPTPLRLDRDTLRIFFVARDEENRGCAAWLDVSADDPLRILAVAERPALIHGEPGSFDEGGIAIGSVVRAGAELRLYYMGWARAAGKALRNEIGLAVCTDGRGERFVPLRAPVLARSRQDPYSLSYPYVDHAAGRWRMLYGTHRGPGETEADMRHAITHATSADGVNWRAAGADLLAPGEGEFGLSRPWPFERDGETFLLFSIRRAHYTVGLARRAGPDRWERRTSDLLGPSEADWDSDATCYASHVRLANRDLLFYCGNGYGRTGFGVAEIDSLEADRLEPDEALPSLS